jgi:hypothetical protein
MSSSKKVNSQPGTIAPALIAAGTAPLLLPETIQQILRNNSPQRHSLEISSSTLAENLSRITPHECHGLNE